MIRHGLLIIGAMALCAAFTSCSRAPAGDAAAVEARSRETAASKALDAFMADSDRWSSLPPEQAFSAQRQAGPRIEALVRDVSGTRQEGRALYLLAVWRFQFNDDGAGVDAALDQLQRQSSRAFPAYHHLGRALRAQHLLRQGRMVAAAELAESTAAAVPELAFLRDLLSWHQRIGGSVSKTDGSGLDGQPLDPATGPEPWLLYLHVATWNEAAAFTAGRYRSAIRGDGTIRLVLVVRDGGARRIREDLARMPGSAPCSVLLARDAAEAESMRNAWTPPLDQWTVLLDRSRHVAAVELRPGDVEAATTAR